MSYQRLCFFALLLQISALAQESVTELPDEYDRFVGAHSRGNRTEELLLEFTAVVGDAKLPEEELAGLDASARSLKQYNHRLRLTSYGCTISPTWDIRYFSHTSRGTKGSSGSKVPESNRPRLKELMSNLPDDRRRLPPADRKLLVRARVNEKMTVRVYDRAQFPDAVLELLRLSGGGVSAWSPRIKSSNAIEAHSNASHFGAFALFPDGKRILSSSEYGPLKIWDAATHELLEEAKVLRNEHVERVVLNHDGTIAAIRSSTDCFVFNAKTWKLQKHIRGPTTPGVSYCLHNIRFVAGGKALVMQTNEPNVYAYDTETWKPIEALPGLPENAWTRLQLQKGEFVFLGSRDDRLELWRAGKRYAVLDEDEKTLPGHAALSPDDSMLVVSTTNATGRAVRRAVRLRVWETAKGKFVRELTPFDVRPPERVEGLLWSSDGRYVLGAIRPPGLFDTRYICVWNVMSGRQRGTLVVNEDLNSNRMKSLGPVLGMGWLNNGRTLVAGDEWGAIHFWDFEAALKEIADFEASLREAARK